MMCRRIDESLDPSAGEQDRCADLAKKLGAADPPHEAKRSVEPAIGRLIDAQLGARRKPAILQAATLGIARGAADFGRWDAIGTPRARSGDETEAETRRRGQRRRCSGRQAAERPRCGSRASAPTKSPRRRGPGIASGRRARSRPPSSGRSADADDGAVAVSSRTVRGRSRRDRSGAGAAGSASAADARSRPARANRDTTPTGRGPRSRPSSRNIFRCTR